MLAHRAGHRTDGYRTPWTVRQGTDDEHNARARDEIRQRCLRTAISPRRSIGPTIGASVDEPLGTRMCGPGASVTAPGRRVRLQTD
jgi:hypothetical protein